MFILADKFLYLRISLFYYTVPPKQVTVKVRPEKLRPGTPATLTCESGTSNPVSRLSWLRGNGQPLPAAANSTSPGPYSGLITKSTLSLEVTPDLHGTVITCKADNGIGPQIHDALTLEVLCKFRGTWVFLALLFRNVAAVHYFLSRKKKTLDRDYFYYYLVITVVIILARR